MNFTKKFDRAFQWAGEKMGSESKTGHSDEFKMLEQEMALRYDGTNFFPPRNDPTGGPDLHANMLTVPFCRNGKAAKVD